MPPFFALTARGLEAVSARELSALPGLTLRQTAYRRVTFDYAASPVRLLTIRTVDDLYIDCATWHDIAHTRDILAKLRGLSQQLDLRPAARLCADARPLATKTLFSVTASFIGKRNYSSDEIKQAIAAGIESGHPWHYTADDRAADLNIRVFIEGETAYIGLRLSRSPLHERGYKTVERPGSLKPPVAAAMLMLAGIQPGLPVLDPCCGAGTILIEAALLGANPSGGDMDMEAVTAAQTNAAEAGVTVDIQGWDARTLPLETNSIPYIVTNLPWGRQISVDDQLATFYSAVCAEFSRVLTPGGRIAILTSTPKLLLLTQLELRDSIEISLFGQKPTIVVYEKG